MSQLKKYYVQWAKDEHSTAKLYLREAKASLEHGLEFGLKYGFDKLAIRQSVKAGRALERRDNWLEKARKEMPKKEAIHAA